MEEARTAVSKEGFGDYQNVAQKMKNFLGIAAEKKSKQTGELFREHIPTRVFGVSSDEIATDLGMSENEFMAKLLSDVKVISEGKATQNTISGFSAKVKKLSTLYDKLDPKFYTIIKDWENKVQAVSAQATPQIIERIALRENNDAIRSTNKLFQDWQNSYKNETISSAERLNQVSKTIKQATDDSIRERLKKQAGDVTIFDWVPTPENVFKKLGLSEPFDNLRTATNQYEDELNTTLTQFGKWFKEIKNIKGSEVRIFDNLDGSPVQLSDKETQIANNIKTYFSMLADRLGLPQEKRISDYVTHIFEPELTKQQIPPEIMAALEYATPRGVFNPFLEKRLNASGYIHDVWRALEAYTSRGLRKIHLDQPIDRFGAFVDYLPDGAQQYTKSFLNYIVGRPDKLEQLVDTTIRTFAKHISNKTVRDYFASRPTKKVFGALNMQVYRGALGLSVGSALKNLTQVVNTFAEEGPVATMKGYMGLLNPRNLTNIEKQNLMKEMIGAEYRNKPLRSALEKFDKGLFVFFDLAERINRGSAYLAAKSNAIKKGLSPDEVINYALAKVRKTQFSYQKIDTPLILQNPIAKTAFQFSTFPIKQLEFLGGAIKEKDAGKILRYVTATLGITWAVGDMLNMDWKDSLIKNIFPSFGPVPSALNAVMKTLTAKDERQIEEGKKQVQKSLSLFLPAGIQAKKTTGAIENIIKGGAYTEKGLLKFPAPQGSLDQLKSILFGQYGTKEARDYYDKNQRPLSKNQTRKVEQNPEVYGILQEKRRIEGIKSKISDIKKDKDISLEEKKERIDKLYQEMRTR